MINLYLNNAMDIAQQGQDKRIAVFTEVPFEHPCMPGIGPISGNLDYLCSSVRSAYDVEELSRFAEIATPYFLIVEAKHAGTVGSRYSHGQLIAQLISLQYHN